MREAIGNLWGFHAVGYWVVVTTNGSVRKDGLAVMGRGVAREAAERFPELPRLLGKLLNDYGNVLCRWPPFRVITFPVKHAWYEEADLRLVKSSALTLADEANSMGVFPIYLVRPGCGNGGLAWEDVRRVLAPILDDRFVVVERP